MIFLGFCFVQFSTAIFVLGIFLPLSNSHIKWIVASGLAQVSEFSFVLGSRARRLGLLSREVSFSGKKYILRGGG